MQLTTQAIVFSSIKYGESSLIVKAFTASDGVKTYMLKGVLASRKGRLKGAYFQPLTQLELVVNHRNKGTLEHIREVRINYPYQDLHTHTVKRTISLFLAEMLAHSIREEERNQELYNYLEAALQWLDTHEHIANFHIFFLLELTRYLGFYPDISGWKHPYFDLLEGCFTGNLPNGPSISGPELEHFKSFLGIEFDGLAEIRLGQKSRNSLLDILLQYYKIHLEGFNTPRSLAVLNEVFR